MQTMTNQPRPSELAIVLLSALSALPEQLVVARGATAPNTGSETGELL